MAIINRSLDASQQVYDVSAPLGALATTETHVVYVAPYPATIKQVKAALLGLSGAPQHALWLNRVGFSGAVAAAAAIPAVGTSGPIGLSLVAAGSSLLNLQAGDWLTVVTSVANTAVTDATYSLVLQAVQDIKTFYGTSYS